MYLQVLVPVNFNVPFHEIEVYNDFLSHTTHEEKYNDYLIVRLLWFSESSYHWFTLINTFH